MILSSINEEILSAERGNKKAALCLIISARGSTPREAGSKMLVYEDSSIFGSIGGGDLEKKVISNALEVLKDVSTWIFKLDLLHQHGMCCGGYLEIYIEPIMKKSRLYIFGAGHIGKAVA